MNKLERILDKIEKENKKREDSNEKIKELKLQAKELEKEFENKRKIEKGEAFEKFENKITSKATLTDGKFVSDFLEFVFEDERFKDILTDLTDSYLSNK